MHQALSDATKVNDLTEEEFAKSKRAVSAPIAVVDNVLYQDELGLIDSEVLAAGSQAIEAQFRTWEALEVQIPLRESSPVIRTVLRVGSTAVGPR